MGRFERPQPKLGTEGDVVVRRVAAIIVDLLLLGVFTSIIGAGIGPGAAAGAIGLVVSFGYYIYFEGTYGQTVLDLVVVTEDGGGVDYGPAAIRTLLRVVDVLPVLYLLGFVLILATDRKQRLGDIAADTVVVRAR